ncbi:MAG: hypothetical protein IJ715_03255 [Bacilli bacterium]|nr:hypothetical protein [Bacilli bacterium]
MNLIYCLVFLAIFSDLVFIFKNAQKYNIFKEDAWYCKWQYWTIATLCFVFPVFIMAFVFLIQTLCGLANHYKVSGSTIYNMPYSWILSLIIPFVGWALFIVMLLYINIFSIIKAFK